MENAKANYCPTCGSKCRRKGVCAFHRKITLGPPLRVCHNGHIVEVLSEEQ